MVMGCLLVSGLGISCSHGYDGFFIAAQNGIGIV